MLRIGDFAKLSQVTVKALRFYEEIGLLKPTFVDPTTAYRYYSPHLLSHLRQILAFKELGFSLAETSSLLQADLSDDALRRIMQRKRAELSQRIALAQVQLAQIDAWLQQLSAADEIAEPTIVLKQTPSQLVASVRATIDEYEETDELFDELQHHLRRYGRTGQRATIWHACAVRSDHIDCEALILLSERVPESRRVRVYELPAGTAASVIHQGADEMIDQSYRAARRWIKAQGYTPAGPNREVYWPAAHGQADADGLTEIQFPIFLGPKTIAAGN
jgi:DNA-binding transcriptional MerR regulator